MVHAELYFPMEKRARFHDTNESLSAIFQYGGSGAVFNSRYTASCRVSITGRRVFYFALLNMTVDAEKSRDYKVHFNICSPVIVAYFVPRADEQCKLVRY